MKTNRYLRLVSGLLVLLTAMIAGCGERGDDDDINRPSVPATSTKVLSSSVNGHQHSVVIPFTDLGSPVQVNYTSSQDSGHGHVVALSARQLTDLNAGMRIIVTSAAAADGHTHAWEFLGGIVLYDSICYNCHSDDKRGASGMPGTNYTTQTQNSALANPNAAPLSVAPAADPNSIPAPDTGAVDGSSLYAAKCAACHSPLAVSTKRGRSASQIRNAINTPSTGMGSLGSLTDAQIQAIAIALQ